MVCITPIEITLPLKINFIKDINSVNNCTVVHQELAEESRLREIMNLICFSFLMLIDKFKLIGKCLMVLRRMVRLVWSIVSIMESLSCVI